MEQELRTDNQADNRLPDLMVEIKDLEFEYHREHDEIVVKAIDGVSMDIPRGSFTAIIGKNGSGKSTLAKNINVLIRPTSGVVYVNGYDTREDNRLWEIRQVAGMVFQNPDNQLVSAVVEDDVAFGPENLAIPPEEIRTRVDEALKAVHMYEERKKAPHLLSGGQKQRVAIAGVVAMKPQCIILDEPTAMLDPHGRKEVMEIVDRLHREGITIILITHFMEEAARADQVFLMDQGKIALSGTPEQVFSEPEKIRALGLDVPFIVELRERLIGRGLSIPNHIVSEEAMVQFLCQSR